MSIKDRGWGQNEVKKASKGLHKKYQEYVDKHEGVLAHKKFLHGRTIATLEKHSLRYNITWGQIWFLRTPNEEIIVFGYHHDGKEAIWHKKKSSYSGTNYLYLNGEKKTLTGRLPKIDNVHRLSHIVPTWGPDSTYKKQHSFKCQECNLPKLDPGNIIGLGSSYKESMSRVEDNLNMLHAGITSFIDYLNRFSEQHCQCK